MVKFARDLVVGDEIVNGRGKNTVVKEISVTRKGLKVIVNNAQSYCGYLGTVVVK